MLSPRLSSRSPLGTHGFSGGTRGRRGLAFCGRWGRTDSVRGARRGLGICQNPSFSSLVSISRKRSGHLSFRWRHAGSGAKRSGRLSFPRANGPEPYQPGPTAQVSGLIDSRRAEGPSHRPGMERAVGAEERVRWSRACSKRSGLLSGIARRGGNSPAFSHNSCCRRSCGVIRITHARWPDPPTAR